MESLQELLSYVGNHGLLVSVLALGVCFPLGLLIGRIGKRAMRADVQTLSAQLARAENQTKEHSPIVARMQAEQGTVASLALCLPAVVRELNHADLDPRRVPGLILQLAEAIFEPGQILFYVACARDDAGAGEGQELRLISHRGLSDVPDELRRIAIGQGKIGWVAEHKLDMLHDSWRNLARIEQIRVEDNHPLLQPDILGPLVHSNLDEENLLGVLCIGSPRRRPRDEKLMFQLVTNLGSLAMVNADYRSRLRVQANHDGLTGLINKRHFEQLLAELMFNAGRTAEPLSLFLFDIDHFKCYNDTNGHLAGDELLRELSRLIRESVRPDDRCCRYGGEEFIVAMPGTDAQAAFGAAERIRRAIEEHPFANRERQPKGTVTISGGVAVFPKDGTDGTELTDNADRAMYKAKHAGRNQVVRFRGVEIGRVDDDCREPALSD